MREDHTYLDQYQKCLQLALKLAPFGWKLVSGDRWLFERDGLLFDLSVADPEKQEEIFQKRTFMVD